jgi:hypothetical protein
MPTFKLDLDQKTYEKLLTIALRERRPTRWQAEVMLTQAVAQEEDGEGSPPQDSLAGGSGDGERQR